MHLSCSASSLVALAVPVSKTIRARKIGFYFPQKIECGSSQPLEPHRYVGSCSPLVTAGAVEQSLRPDSVRAAVAQTPRLPKPIALPITRSRTQPPRRPAALSRYKEQEGEEAATPGQPVRALRVFWKSPSDSPSRITGCRQLFRDHSVRSGTLTFSLHTLSARLQRPAIQKIRSPVKKVWTMGLPCGRKRKTQKSSKRFSRRP